jgi:hypothetical protein
LLVTYFPYQWALVVPAIRAVWRELRGQTNWEKTAHVDAHRQHEGTVVVSHDDADLLLGGLR